MTAAINGGMASRGFLIKFGNCTLGVINDCAMLAPASFCLKDIAVKPANWTVQPIKAAALETGSSCNAIAIAAEEAGDIRKILHTSDITIGPMMGEPATDEAICALSHSNSGVVMIDKNTPAIPPTKIAANGIAIISSFVFPATRLPTQVATTAAITALNGCPVTNVTPFSVI